MVCDLERSTVEFIAENCKQTSLERYFTRLAADQVVGIKAIALDMREPYTQAIRANVPDAGSKSAFDRYHIMTRTWARPWTTCAYANTAPCRRPGTRRRQGPSTRGSTRRKICPSNAGHASPTSRP